MGRCTHTPPPPPQACPSYSRPPATEEIAISADNGGSTAPAHPRCGGCHASRQADDSTAFGSTSSERTTKKRSEHIYFHVIFSTTFGADRNETTHPH